MHAKRLVGGLGPTAATAWASSAVSTTSIAGFRFRPTLVPPLDSSPVLDSLLAAGLLQISWC